MLHSGYFFAVCPFLFYQIQFLYRGLCPDFYPDTICRGNYSLHSYDPPLLYNLHNDPSEIYALDVKEYTDVMKEIEMVSACVWYDYGSFTVCIYCDLHAARLE